MELIRSFAPIVTPQSRILILGTMPGVASLEKQQYYGHPRNAFWRIIATLTGGQQVPDEYEDRLKMLRGGGIALWDVCHSCRREGSLDSHIYDEVPNDIRTLLAEYPAIRAIAFNGGPAHRLFKKHIGLGAIGEGRGVLPMPSTSPANASYSFDRKLEQWSKLKEWL